MKKILIIVLLLITAVVTYAWATATSETGDTRAIPIVLYGKTSGGVLTAIQVDSNGVIQTTT